jgi:hypothetical protein
MEEVEGWIETHARDERVHAYTAAYMTWNYLASKANTEADKCASVLMALRDLVALKEHKDAHGKDAEYQTMQPLVWDQACEALKKFE